MSKAIATNKIGGDLYCAGDVIWDGEALGAGVAKASGTFSFAQTMGAQGINLVADESITVGADETLLIEVVTGDSFDEAVWTATLTGEVTFAEGEVIAQIVAGRDVDYCTAKLQVTPSEDLSAKDVSAYFVGM